MLQPAADERVMVAPRRRQTEEHVFVLLQQFNGQLAKRQIANLALGQADELCEHGRRIELAPRQKTPLVKAVGLVALRDGPDFLDVELRAEFRVAVDRPQLVALADLPLVLASIGNPNCYPQYIIITPLYA